MNFLYYFTSINDYTFSFLVFLFIISFIPIKQKIKFIVFIRVLIGTLIFSFYFIGWETFGYYKNVPYKGKKINFSQIEMVQICNLPNVIKFLNGAISPLHAHRYDCYITDADSTLLKYYPKKLKEIGLLQIIPKNKTFTILDYHYIKTRGILLNSFSGSKVNSYTLIDENNTTYYIYDGSVEREIGK